MIIQAKIIYEKEELKSNIPTVYKEHKRIANILNNDTPENIIKILHDTLLRLAANHLIYLIKNDNIILNSLSTNKKSRYLYNIIDVCLAEINYINIIKHKIKDTKYFKHIFIKEEYYDDKPYKTQYTILIQIRNITPLHLTK
jgi:hypothetical protein